MAVMPLSPALIVLMAWPMPSFRLVRSLARWFSDFAAKNAVGESRAELTLLPVDRRVWVRSREVCVVCSRRRLLRIEAESWTLLAIRVCSLLEAGFQRRPLSDAPTADVQRARLGSNFPASR